MSNLYSKTILFLRRKETKKNCSFLTVLRIECRKYIYITSKNCLITISHGKVFVRCWEVYFILDKGTGDISEFL